MRTTYGHTLDHAYKGSLLGRACANTQPKPLRGKKWGLDAIPVRRGGSPDYRFMSVNWLFESGLTLISAGNKLGYKHENPPRVPTALMPLGYGRFRHRRQFENRLRSPQRPCERVLPLQRFAHQLHLQRVVRPNHTVT